MRSKYLINFSWHIGDRFGGPPGYIYNLWDGLNSLGLQNNVNFNFDQIFDQEKIFPNNNPEHREHFFNFSRETANEKAQNYVNFLNNWKNWDEEDWVLKKSFISAKKLVVSHTTIDIIKMHNSLVKLGLRHKIKLGLTSHCPELPALEQSQLYAGMGASEDIVSSVYNSQKKIDMLAFSLADFFIFPCQESLEPYFQTFPDFNVLINTKLLKFVPTGCKKLPDIKKKLNLKKQQKDSFRICFLGRHNEVKGYKFLKEVASKLFDNIPELEIIVGGKEGPIETPNYKKWTEVGWIDEPRALLEEIDVFVLPNERTYFDLILLEALSIGSIVLVSETGGNKFFSGKADGIFTYLGERTFIETLIFLSKMSSLEIRRLKKSNVNYYNNFHTSEIFAQNYLNVLEEIEKYFNHPHELILIEENIKSKNIHKKTVVKVSMIVPVYNMELYLETCLQSLKQQTLKECEFLIINDGSTDSSLKIIQNFIEIDDRFKLLNIPNSGLSSARNVGIKQAKGEFITFLDSDDYISPDFLDILFTNVVDKNADIAFCGVNYIDQDSNLIRVEEPFNTITGYQFNAQDGVTNPSFEQLISIWPSAWNKIYRRTLFEHISFPDGFIYEDNETFIRLGLSSNKIFYIPQPLYFHRNGNLGKLSKTSDSRVLQIFGVVDRIISIANEYRIGTDTLYFQNYLDRLAQERVIPGDNSFYSIFLLDNLFERDNVLCSRSKENFELTKNIKKTRESVLGNSNFSSEFFNITNFFSTKNNPFELVRFDNQFNSYLIHPTTNNVTIARQSGLTIWGDVKIEMTFCLMNSESKPVDYKIVFTKENIKDIKAFNEATVDVILSQSGWRTINPNETRDNQFMIKNYSPNAVCYMISKMNQNQSNSYAWFHLTSFKIDKIKRI